MDLLRASIPLVIESPTRAERKAIHTQRSTTTFNQKNVNINLNPDLAFPSQLSHVADQPRAIGRSHVRNRKVGGATQLVFPFGDQPHTD